MEEKVSSLQTEINELKYENKYLRVQSAEIYELRARLSGITEVKWYKRLFGIWH